MEGMKKPLGVSILGWLNCFVFGLLFLLVSVSAYLKTTPKDLNEAIEIFKSKGIAVEVTHKQFKTACLVYAVISSIFFLSGWGILLKKEWARKLTIYFAFCIVIFISVAILLVPALVKQVFFQLMYTGIMIIYFTNKNIEQYFMTAKPSSLKLGS